MHYTLRFPLAALLTALCAAFFMPSISHATTYQIGMGPNYFTYPSITIYVGDTVTWTNTDSTAHTVTSGNSQFDGGTMQPGAIYSKTFTVPGTYNYECTLHNGMKGVVIVKEAPIAPVATQVSATQSSAAASDLQTKLNGLLQQLATLQKQIATTPAASSGGSCIQLPRSLALGMEGADVTALQQFLARDPAIYPEGKVTGYFGALTEAAVKRFQAKNGIVSSGTPSTTGYGRVGPKTIGAITLGCSGTSGGSYSPADSANDVGGIVKATPLTGSAPLRVTFQVTVNITNSCVGRIYNLDFGDGTSQPIPSVAGVCQPQSVAISHVYQYGGAFKVTLSTGEHSTFTTVTVSGVTQPNTQQLPQVAVKITDSVFTPASLSVDPGTMVVWTNSGTVPYSVTFNSGLIDSGSINPGQMFSTLFTQSGTFPYYSKFHGTPNSGMRGTITVGAGTGGTASTTQNTSSGGYGPLTVTPGQGKQVTATFAVKNSCDAYSLDWGDDSNNVYRFQGSTNCTSTADNITLTHTYDTAKTYTVTLGRGPAFLDEVTASVVVQ